MVASVSCAGLPKDFPQPPKPTLKQTLFEQRLCDKNGQNCKVITACWFWQLDAQGEWVKVGEGPLKNSNPERSCHGSFGLSAREINEFKEYVRRVNYWREQNCGAKSH